MFDIYLNTTVDGVTKYVRPFQTSAYDPLGGVPSVTVMEEQVVESPDGTVTHTSTTQLEASFPDPTMTFPLVDPTSGATIGTCTIEQLLIAKYSLYLYLAAQRDAANEAAGGQSG